MTFLFTDVEGSTRLLHELGAEGYAAALAEHRRLLRDAFGRHGGVEVDTQGDAFFVAFPTASGAVRAAEEARDALASGPIRVRIGIHTGTPLLTDEGYVGADVHRAARIAAAGHGGQVLLSAATAALTGSTGLRDLGHQRLKDLSAPERIYQLGEADFPRLKSLYQTNLPVPTTPFLGREQELAEVTGLLARDDVRVLTLTGPGGTGKTRLAAQAVGRLADRYPDGVWWVPLAPLRDPQLVIETASRAVGASNGLADHIGDKSMLLLLDNFEQVVEAAGDVAELLAACPRLEAVVTSREPLHISGEQEYQVPPLAHAEGVELFTTRGRAVRPDFQPDAAVGEICRRLDNLPLAIELAAARVRALSPQQVLQRLEQRLPLLTGGARDLPERQRTLRGAIEWSYELLSPEEQRAFARLAVFRGGCRLEAAEQVAEADIDTLESLVDKSLLRQRDERFWMLETIREFAAEQLGASGELDELRRRHADFFLALADEAEPHVRHDSRPWLDRLEGEHDNLRAALDRLALASPQLHQRLAGALWRFWYLHSHLSEGWRRLEAAFALDDRPTPARAAVLRGASVMALNLGDISAARRYAEQGLELDRVLGNKWGVAYASMMIGNSLAEAHDASRDLPSARDWLGTSAQLFDELGDRHYGLIARHNQAWITGDLGDVETEERMHEENLLVAREIGNEGIEADALAQLGMAARDDGRLEDAAAMLRQSIEIDMRRGMRHNVITQLSRLASVLVRRGDATGAARLLGAADAAMDQLGAIKPWWSERRDEETLGLITSAIGRTAAEAALAAGRALGFEAAVELALASPDRDASRP